MRVCLLVHDLSPSGGVKVIVSHARALAAAGVDVDLVLTGGEPPSVEGLPTRSLEQARVGRYDWAIATWWETAAALYELEAERRMVFLQSFEQRFYTEDEALERLGAAAVFGLPVDFIVISDWMGKVLAELRPDARFRVVRNGIDKQLFSSVRRTAREGPLRVLVEGQPSLWFKGVERAIDVVGAMREPVKLTLVALDPPAASEVEPHRVVGALSPAEMAELYAQSDMLLKLSRIEGLPLPLLEAAHAGVPAIVAPFGAHADIIEHGRNGLVVGYDDIPGTARALDLLAADRALLERLGQGALATAEGWPDEAESSQAFLAALEELDALPPPAPEPALAALLATLRFHQETGRTRAIPDRLRAAETELAQAQALVHELSASRDECGEMLNEARAELEHIRSALPYRVAARARRALGRARS